MEPTKLSSKKWLPRKIKILLILVFIALLLTVNFGFKQIKVDIGEEAVLVMEPYNFFDNGGIDPTSISTGSHWVAITTRAIPYKIVPQPYHENCSGVGTFDGFSIDFDLNIQLQIISGKGPELFRTNGKDWYENRIKPKVCELVYKEMYKYTLSSLVARGQNLVDAKTNVMTEFQAYIHSINIPINLIDVTFDKMSPKPKGELIETPTQPPPVKSLK